MQNNDLSKPTYSFGISLAVCAVLNGVLVIAKELNKSVMDRMQKTTGHQWTTHALLVLAVFLVLGGLLNLKSGSGPAISSPRLIGTVLAGVGAGVVMILGFYLFVD